MIATSRRSFITGLIAFAAAPAIVRAESLMPVKVMPFNVDTGWIPDPYGRSPMMDALADLLELGRAQVMTTTDLLNLPRFQNIPIRVVDTLSEDAWIIRRL